MTPQTTFADDRNFLTGRPSDNSPKADCSGKVSCPDALQALSAKAKPGDQFTLAELSAITSHKPRTVYDAVKKLVASHDFEEKTTHNHTGRGRLCTYIKLETLQ